MHVIAAILLASPRIYYGCIKRQGQQKKEVKNKIWVSVKFNEDPIFFDILNLVVLVLYMGVLVAASQFVNECHGSFAGKSLMIDWIRLELVVFFSNLIGIALFLIVKSVFARFRFKIQN